MIFEIMGRPPEYIRETLSQLIDKIKEEKGCSIESKKVFDPKPVEQQPGIFTTFAEVEFHFEKMEDLLRVVFNHLPSHVDIIRPQSANVTNVEFNFLMNDLAMNLHHYDEVAKRILLENDYLKKYAGDLRNQLTIKEKEANVQEKPKKKVRKKKAAPLIENEEKITEQNLPQEEKNVKVWEVDNAGKVVEPEEEPLLEAEGEIDMDEVLKDDDPEGIYKEKVEDVGDVTVEEDEEAD